MNLSNINLDILAISASTFCAFFCCITVFSYWKPRLPKFLSCIIGAVFIGFATWASFELENEIAAYMILVFVEVLFCKFMAHTTWDQALFAGVTSTFHTLCLKGITVGILSFVLKKNLYQIITNSDLVLLALSMAMMLKAFCFIFHRLHLSRKKLRTLLLSEDELKIVSSLHIALLIFMLFYSYNYYYNLDLVWFSLAQTFLSAIMFILYYLILNYGMRVSYLLENELQRDTISKRLNTQLAQYQVYEETFSKIEVFKNSFREKTLKIEQLLESGNVRDAHSYFENTYLKIVDSLPTKKTYSNTEMINAFILGWDSECDVSKVNLEAQIYIPDRFFSHQEVILQLLFEIHDIYTSLASDVPNSTIKVISSISQNQFTLSAEGSYKGIIESKGDLPYFVTKDALKIKSNYHRVFNLTNDLSGKITWKATKAPSKFLLSITVPQ